MVALIANGNLVGLFATDEHARSVAAQLKLADFEVKPATFGDEAGKIKLDIRWKLEKFAGDVQSPETLIETREGEG